MAPFTLSGVVSVALYLSLSRAYVAPKWNLRPMSSDDLDAVSTTFVAAFDPGTIWTYAYQFRDQYPCYHWRCFREQFEKLYRNTTDRDYLMVLAPPGEEDDMIRSIAWWEMMKMGERVHGQTIGRNILSSGFVLDSLGSPPTANAEQAGGQIGLILTEPEDDLGGQTTEEHEDEADVQDAKLPCSRHLDMNITRGIDLESQIHAAISKYIDDAYDHQLYLSILATHPDWDGHGFGAAQLEWGMEKAKAEEKRLSEIEGRRIRVPITLLSSPAGYPLYKSEGFESVANVTLTLLDDFQGGVAWFEYMRWFSPEV